MNRRDFLIGSSCAAVTVAVPSLLAASSPAVVGMDFGASPSLTTMALLCRKNGKTLMLAEWQEFVMTEICRKFQIPAHQLRA